MNGLLNAGSSTHRTQYARIRLDYIILDISEETGLEPRQALTCSNKTP